MDQMVAWFENEDAGGQRYDVQEEDGRPMLQKVNREQNMPMFLVIFMRLIFLESKQKTTKKTKKKPLDNLR